MAPATMEKKEEQKTSGNLSQSASTRGVKRSAEEGANEDTNGVKRRRSEEEGEEESMHMEEDKENEVSDAHQISETSFMDLPDDVLIKLFAFLDATTSRNLRLNHRLDGLHFSLTKNHWKTLHFKIGRSGCRFTRDYHSRIPVSDIALCEEGLNKFARNTFVDEISIAVDSVPNEEHCRLIDAIFQFKANKLKLDQKKRQNYDRKRINFNLSHLTLPSFLILAQNVREVEVRLECIQFTADDLCAIRQNMLEGSCMKSFSISISKGMKKSFVNSCFGVTISKESHPINGKIYHVKDDSLEMYHGRESSVHHFEDDLQTSVFHNYIAFKKLDVVEKPDNDVKIKFNCYVYV